MNYKAVLEEQITKLEEIQDKVKSSTLHLDSKCTLICEVSKNIISLVSLAQDMKPVKGSKEE